MFKAEKGVVSIWLGCGTKKNVFDKYFEESRGWPGDEEAPLNEFARDAGELFYDHDFVEAHWAGPKGKRTGELLINHSYGKSFADAGEKKARQAGFEAVNFVFLMYDIRLQPARWPKQSPVRYIGAVPYEIPFDTPDVRPDDHRTPINETAVTADGRFGLSTSRDAELRLWNLKTGKLIDSQRHPGTILPDMNNRVRLLCWTPNGKQCVSYMTKLAFWQPTTRGLKCVRTIKSPHSAGVSAAAISANARRLITASFDKNLAVYNLPGGQSTLLRGHAGRVYGLGLMPDGRVLSMDDADELRIWDLPSASTVAHFKVKGSTPSFLHIRKDGKTAVVATFRDRLLLIDLRQGALVKGFFQGVSGSLSQVAVTADEQFVIGAGGPDRAPTVRVWDLRSGRLVHTMRGHAGEVTDLAVSRGGRVAVTVSLDANLIVWNLRSGKELARFRDAPAHRPAPQSYDPDGYVLNSVALTPKADTIVVGEHSGRVRILRLDKSALTLLR